MIVFGIHCNFCIVLPIQLKTCRSNGILFYTRQNVRARKIGRVSKACDTNINGTIAPQYAHSFSLCSPFHVCVAGNEPKDVDLICSYLIT